MLLSSFMKLILNFQSDFLLLMFLGGDLFG